jgi:hypothetical protein
MRVDIVSQKRLIVSLVSASGLTLHLKYVSITGKYHLQQLEIVTVAFLAGAQN